MCELLPVGFEPTCCPCKRGNALPVELQQFIYFYKIQLMLMAKVVMAKVVMAKVVMANG